MDYARSDKDFEDDDGKLMTMKPVCQNSDKQDQQKRMPKVCYCMAVVQAV